MTQISIFFLNFNCGEQWWFNTWNIDAAIDCWKNAFNARMADTDAECVNARCVQTPVERIFWILIARPWKLRTPRDKTKHSAPKRKMVRSTLSEIWSTLLRRFFRFRSIWKSFKITQFWKVLQRIMIHVSHSLKWSMPQKTKLHDIFRLHASRFFEASTEWGKKYDFRFLK